MRPIDFNIHELIDKINGSRDSIEENLPDGMSYNDLTPKDLQTIQQTIFCCNDCSTWCDVENSHESDDGDLCDDCFGDRGDE